LKTYRFVSIAGLRSYSLNNRSTYQLMFKIKFELFQILNIHLYLN
jgi:hypothetical protein